MPAGRPRILVLAVALAMLGAIGATNALGASISLAQPYAPAAEIPSVLTLNAQSDTANARVYLDYRPAGGAPCAPTADSDPGTFLFNGDGLSGGTPSRTQTFPKSGEFLMCGWLRDSGGTYTATFSQTITVRAPIGSLALSVPPLAPYNRAFVITFSGQTEVKRYVYATIRPAGGSPCAPTYQSDSGTSIAYGTTAEGAFSLPTQETLSTRGNFMICAWLAGSSSDLTPLATTQAVFTDVPPVIISPKPIVSSVKVAGRKLRTTLGLSKGGRIVVRLIGKGRRIGVGAVNASGPRTVVISYTRPRSVKTGRYTLEMTFTAKGATTASVARRYVTLR